MNFSAFTDGRFTSREFLDGVWGVSPNQIDGALLAYSAHHWRLVRDDLGAFRGHQMPGCNQMAYVWSHRGTAFEIAARTNSRKVSETS